MNKVLIVVDMQNDFIDGSLGTKEAQGIVPGVLKEIKKDYSFIYATRDTHPVNYLETNEGRHLPVEHCIKGSEGWQIRKEVEEALREKEHEIVDKPTFGSEVLVEKLKERNAEKEIDEFVFVGLCTDICVVSNALLVKAAFPEKKLTVLKDCCAGVTPESHEAALSTMKMCQIGIE